MTKLRHNRQNPCPVCGGYDGQARGGGTRCHGFTSRDGKYAHCSRVECGEQEAAGTYAHRLDGSCRCGTTHGSATVETNPPESAVCDHVAAWQALERRSAVGERYLQARGFDPHELRERGLVRFHKSGSIAVVLRDLLTGEICGIQYRRIDGAEPKVLTARGSKCSGAALHGRVADLAPDGVDVAVIVEGLADTLAASLAFPGCAVYGAPGAGQLAGIATAIARRVRDVRGWLLIVVDDDDIGVRRAADAVNAAKSAGLHYVPLAEQSLKGASEVRLVDIGEHHDLADAWKAGWRYRWPGQGGAA